VDRSAISARAAAEAEKSCAASQSSRLPQDGGESFVRTFFKVRDDRKLKSYIINPIA
jgi:hypothetical protein